MARNLFSTVHLFSVNVVVNSVELYQNIVKKSDVTRFIYNQVPSWWSPGWHEKLSDWNHDWIPNCDYQNSHIPIKPPTVVLFEQRETTFEIPISGKFSLFSYFFIFDLLNVQIKLLKNLLISPDEKFHHLLVWMHIFIKKITTGILIFIIIVQVSWRFVFQF